MYLLVYALMTFFSLGPHVVADHLLSALSGDFAVKDLDTLHYFLEIEVSSFFAGLTLT
jgi:hypothetical protein